MNDSYKLMSNKDITKNYADKYKIYGLYNNNKNEYNDYIRYISVNFGISIDILKNIDKLFDDNNKKSDADVYFKLRQLYEKNVTVIINKIDALYESKHITKKINNIINVIPPNNNIKNVLDVGTEHDIFLDQLSNKMNCRVIGLNVDNYSHYHSYQKAIENGKIIIYDGINFPFTNNEFDLVTVLATLHHIPDIEIFLHYLLKITKSIYIKDNDMLNDLAYTMVELQHELYEGILYPTPRTNLYRYSLDTIINIIKKNNFEIKYNSKYGGFTNFYILYAIKI